MVALILTGLDDEERNRYSQLHARVQAGLADLGISQVCVTSTPVRRTLKLLTALAHGAWVVGEDYLQACARSRSTLDPEPFELVAEIPGCRAARLGGCGSVLQRRSKCPSSRAARAASPLSRPARSPKAAPPHRTERSAFAAPMPRRGCGGAPVPAPYRPRRSPDTK